MTDKNKQTRVELATFAASLHDALIKLEEQTGENVLIASSALYALVDETLRTTAEAANLTDREAQVEAFKAGLDAVVPGMGQQFLNFMGAMMVYGAMRLQHQNFHAGLLSTADGKQTDGVLEITAPATPEAITARLKADSEGEDIHHGVAGDAKGAGGTVPGAITHAFAAMMGAGKNTPPVA